MDLKVKNREILGKKVKRLRKEGFIPAEIFGHGSENEHLKINKKDFNKVYKQAGKSTIINLNKDGKESIPALIYNVQFHPISREPITIDFYRIREGEKITTEIPIIFEGEAPAEKDDLVIIKVIDEIEIESLPKDIPHEFKVDLTKIKKLEDRITIADLDIPEGVEVQLPENTVIISVSEKQEEIIEEEPVTETELEEGILGDKTEEDEDPLSDSGDGESDPLEDSSKEE
ncbi:MAG: 50S ribosomal protein L25 [Candidatus Paceibacterota bacterium]